MTAPIGTNTFDKPHFNKFFQVFSDGVFIQVGEEFDALRVRFDRACDAGIANDSVFNRGVALENSLTCKKRL